MFLHFSESKEIPGYAKVSYCLYARLSLYQICSNGILKRLHKCYLL